VILMLAAFMMPSWGSP